MKKRHMTLITAFAAAAAFASTAQAAPIVAPTDGYMGPYRLAFQTNGSTLATLAQMSDYNTFVTTEAGLITELAALGTTWTAIGSTKTQGGINPTPVDARDNTNTNPTVETGVPIYTTTGLRIADDNADLWDGSIQNPIFYGDGTDPLLAHQFAARAFTGTASDGTAYTVGDGDSLSSGDGTNQVNIRMARGGNTDGCWVGCASFSDYDPRGLKMLAISGVIGSGTTADPDFAITSISYDQASEQITLTWTSSPNRTYAVFFSEDLNFGADVADSVVSAGDTTSLTFSNPAPGARQVFFRISENGP